MIAIHSDAGDRRSVSIAERRAAAVAALPMIPIQAADIPERVDVDQLLHQVNTILASKLPIRVFIYSAEGTEEERRVLPPLIDRVQEDLRERVRLVPVFWPETQANEPSEMDIVVFLMWAHTYTRLPRPFSDLNAWMKVDLTTLSGVLLYYKETNSVWKLTTSERLQLIAETTASANAAIDRWLCPPGKELLEIGRATMTGNPPPDFAQDFRRYLEEFVKKSLTKSQSQSEKATPGTWSFGIDEQPILIPDRFREHRVQYRIDPSRPSRHDLVTKATILRKAHFSAFAPATVIPNNEFILEIWTCRQSEFEYDEVVRRATRERPVRNIGDKEGVPVALGTWLTVSVSIPGFGVYSVKDRMYWDGNIANTSFSIRVPNDSSNGYYVGHAQIAADTVPIATLHFQLAVATSLSPPAPLQSQEKAIHSIFASYASEDRTDVLQWTRGAEAVGVNVFIDVTELRAGANWEVELFRQVPSKDLFSLFWSKPASKSRWVEMEWRCALAARGLDYIYPVALADPRSVPPPRELMAKHFNDVKMALIEYEKGFRSEGEIGRQADN
jgi:hypothetical protein